MTSRKSAAMKASSTKHADRLTQDRDISAKELKTILSYVGFGDYDATTSQASDHNDRELLSNYGCISYDKNASIMHRVRKTEINGKHLDDGQKMQMYSLLKGLQAAMGSEDYGNSIYYLSSEIEKLPSTVKELKAAIEDGIRIAHFPNIIHDAVAFETDENKKAALIDKAHVDFKILAEKIRSDVDELLAGKKPILER